MAGKGTMRGSPKPAAEAFHEEITPIAEKDLEVLTQIGSGSFGQVFSARWKKKNNMMVAVKFVNMDKKKEFEAELQSLTNVHHPNIVRLYGASIAPPKFHMVMELCATSLQAYIRKNNYEVTDVYRWSYQTADAMAFLHSKHIVHRDLKTGNILLDDKTNVKICDFGAARSVDATALMTFIGTLGYMAPEMLREQKTSAKVDLFSYGVVLWEMLTRKAPFANMQPVQIIWLVGASGQRLPIPDDCPPVFRQILDATWKDVPNDRPSFVEVLDMLRAGEPSLHVKQDPTVSKTLAQSQQGWQAVIDQTLSNYKDMEKTIQAKMDALKAKEDELRIKANEIKFKDDKQARLPPVPEDDDDDDNVTATLRRIKSMPMVRKPRSTSARLVTQSPSPGHGHHGGSGGAGVGLGERSREALSPSSPSAGLSSTFTPLETPLTGDSSATPVRTPGPLPNVIFEPPTPGPAQTGQLRVALGIGSDTEPPALSPRSAASGPSDSDSIASPAPGTADDETAGEATVVGRPKREASSSASSASSDTSAHAGSDVSEPTVVAPTVQRRDFTLASPTASPAAVPRRIVVRAPSATTVAESPMLAFFSSHLRDELPSAHTVGADSPNVLFFPAMASRGSGSAADSPMTPYHSAHSREASSSSFTSASEGVGSPQPAPFLGKPTGSGTSSANGSASDFPRPRTGSGTAPFVGPPPAGAKSGVAPLLPVPPPPGSSAAAPSASLNH